MTGAIVNPAVVSLIDARRSPWAGIYVAEDIQLLLQGFQSGSWIDESIGGFGLAMDGLGLMVDPLGTIASWGVAWLIEHLKPLSEALDWLAGDPFHIGTQVQTWHAVSSHLAGTAIRYRAALSGALDGWTGAAASAYGDRAGAHLGALDSLSRAADAMATITEGAGMLVALVRTMVRDLIADFVSVLAVRLWEWLAEEGVTLGVATPLVVSQAVTLAGKWAERIARLLRALISSLRRLAPMVRRLEELITSLSAELRRLAHGHPPAIAEAGPWEAWAARGGTRPSRPPDPTAKPRGTPEPAHSSKVNDRGKRRQNESADLLAQEGFDVEQLPGSPPGKRTEPDYRIEGEYADCYAPTTADPDNVRDEISDKVKEQANRIVLNLADTPITLDEVRDTLHRKPVYGLKEILVIRDGQLIRFFPFG